jgi:enamine deaminase RidA (YjgF/YER057c/UK114 family)
MKKRAQIIPEGLGEPQGPYAHGVKAGNLVFTVQIGTGDDGRVVPGGMKAQATQAMENAIRVLATVGATLDDVAKVTIHVTDMALVPEMNEVYRAYFEAGDFPSRCCTCCAGMADGVVVEMEFVAVL